MAVSPRKITKLRKRMRFTNSILIPRRKKLLNRLNNIKKCSICSAYMLYHFSCRRCFDEIINSYPNKVAALEARNKKKELKEKENK